MKIYNQNIFIKYLIIILSFFFFIPENVFSYPNYIYSKNEIFIESIKRNYYIYKPTSQDSSKKLPVIIAFHGLGSNGNGMRWMIDADQQVINKNFIMVFPNGVNNSWNAGKGRGAERSNADDLNFAKNLTKELIEKYHADKDKIFLVGFSNGAQMVNLLLCSSDFHYAGVLEASHIMNIDNCNMKYTPPIIITHGKKDNVVPFNGGSRFNFISHKKNLEFFKSGYKTSSTKNILNKDTVQCNLYSNSKENSKIIDCICNDSGHTWPGGKDFNNLMLGKTNKELNLTDFMFDFFEEIMKN